MFVTTRIRQASWSRHIQVLSRIKQVGHSAQRRWGHVDTSPKHVIRAIGYFVLPLRPTRFPTTVARFQDHLAPSRIDSLRPQGHIVVAPTTVHLDAIEAESGRVLCVLHIVGVACPGRSVWDSSFWAQTLVQIEIQFR